MPNLFRAAKRTGLQLAQATGLSAAVGSSTWRRNRVLILCYHGVSLADEHAWSDLYVTPAHLRRRFSLLRDAGCNVLPLPVALARLEAGTLPPRSVVLTFDDGAYDFLAMAVPLLREFGFHATLYLTTYYCTFPRPVFDTMSSYLLWKGQGRSVHLGEALGGSLEIPVAQPLRRAMHLRLREGVNAAGLGAAEKDDIARRIAGQVGVDYDELVARRLLSLMRPDEVRTLDPSLVSVQLHTHRHRTPRDERLFRRELTDNRQAIAAMTSGVERLEHFCYPSGDHDPMFFDWLAADGVTSATTCESGLASRDSHRFLLPRLIDTMQMPEPLFRGWLNGVAAWLPRRS